MPRDTLNSFSETPTENSDIGGVSILGVNKASNLDDAERATVAILAKAVNGTTPVNDTWTWRDKDAPTKEFRFDAGNLTGSVDIDAKALFDLAEQAAAIIDDLARRSAPTRTAYTASGTHTFGEDTTYFQIVAVGGGGGSGGVDGGASGGASSAGGNSGFHGQTGVLAKGALTTGAVVIGAAGTAGAATAGDGGDGGDTTWTDTTNGTLTWKGGKGSPGRTATSGHTFGLPLANGASSVSLAGTYEPGNAGSTNGNIDAGGIGGSSKWGTGGIPTSVFNDAVAGVVGSGYGAGGSGAAASGVNTNVAGAAGTGGRLEVWEW